jgi:hypothetical protein
MTPGLLERRVGRERLARAKPSTPRLSIGPFVTVTSAANTTLPARAAVTPGAIRLGPLTASSVLNVPAGAGEEHVVDDDLEWRGRGSRDVEGPPRPGPAADLRLEAPDAAIVDADEHDVAPRRRRVGRHAHAMVVRLELDRPEEGGEADGPGQRRRGRARRTRSEPPRPTLHQDTCSLARAPSPAGEWPGELAKPDEPTLRAAVSRRLLWPPSAKLPR